MNPKNGRIVLVFKGKKRGGVAKKGLFNSKEVAELPMQNGGVIGEKKECCCCAKGAVISPFCCDNLIKWNIKCVIFRVRKRGEIDEEVLQYR